MFTKLSKLYFVLFFYCFLILILNCINKLMAILLRSGGNILICYSKGLIKANGMLNDRFFYIYSHFLFYIHNIYMKYIAVHLATLFIFLLVSVNALKVFLLGGAVTDDQADVYLAMAKSTGKTPQPYNCSQDWSKTSCPKVAVITSAAQNEAEGNFYYEVDEPHTMCFKNLFNKYGCSPKHVSVHRDNYQKTTDLNTPEGQKNMQMLKEADIIFFDGGDQIRHSRCWLTDAGTPIPMFQIIIDRAYADKVILGGTSAGTMIWSNPAYGGGSPFGHLYFSQSVGLAPKKISDGAVGGTGLDDVRNGTSGLQYQQNGGMFTGFGFLPFLLDTHFDVRGRLARLVPGQIQTKSDIAIGLDQPSCLYYNNGVGQVYGRKGVFITDTSKATRSQKQYFTVNDVSISYLTSGDTYYFSNNTIVPSGQKHKITILQYKNNYDSNDILSSYECTTLLTRLVDQTPSFNVGRTKTPKGFPSQTPTFKLTFMKGPMTIGYYSTTEKLYTVDKALLTFTYE